MAKLNITIDIDEINTEYESAETHIACLLRRLANRVEESGMNDRTLYDNNGNAIGKAVVEN